jgi:hypothetical protein
VVRDGGYQNQIETLEAIGLTLALAVVPTRRPKRRDSTVRTAGRRDIISTKPADDVSPTFARRHFT